MSGKGDWAGEERGREEGPGRKGGHGKEPWPLGTAHPHMRGLAPQGAPSCAPQCQGCSHYSKQTV